MASFPAQLKYQNKYGWSYVPIVSRTEMTSKNTRQRYIGKNRDMVFDITMQMSNADFVVWEDFVFNTLNNGADTFTAPYYTDETEKTGTFELLNGVYDPAYLNEDLWEITCKFELKDRDMTAEDAIKLAVDTAGSFEAYYASLP